MKKFIYSVMVLAISAMAFTSCEDVPAPYGWPFSDNNGGGGEETQEGVYLSESFASDFGEFTVKTIKGVDWIIDFSTAKATGYADGKTTPSASYLVSPAVDLSKSTGAYLEFEYILRYIRETAVNKVLITDSYSGDPAATTWTDITGTLTEGSDWSTFYTYSVNLPAAFIGKSAVVVALYFGCETNSATWEVKNLKLVEGESQGGGGDTPVGPTEGTGTGTAADPYNVAAALSVTNQLASGASTDEVYVKGIISSIKEVDTGNFGNASYYISDDGTTANQYYVFRGYYLNKEKFTSQNQIKVGDEVVICGKLLNYQGNTPEFAQGNYIYSINGQGGSGGGGGGGTTVGTGSGTAADPYNVAAAISITTKLASGASTDEVYVKGIISSIKEIDTGNFGNASYYISDDGTTANQYYVFRGYYLNKDKFTSQDQIKVGDEVVICGKLLNYQGNTPEFAQGNYIYSINGQGGGGGGGTTVGSGSGTATDPYNVAAALSVTNQLASGASTDEVYVKGIISSIKEVDTGNFGNASYYISDDGTTANQYYVFRGYYLNKEKFTKQDQIKVGDKVVICGKLLNYQGNTPEFAQGNYIYTLNGQSSSGGGGDDPGTTTGNVTKTVDGTTVTLVNNSATASSTTVTVDLNEQGWVDKSDPATITLNDGTTIEFSIGEGKSAPKYYAASKGVRVYAKNTITVKGSKAIAKIVMTCDSYNGTDYIGNSTLYGTVSGKTFKIVNENTEPSGGVQLRVQTITITYAN